MAKIASKVKSKPETNSSFQNVEYMHPVLSDLIPQYNLIRDCVAGSMAVKAKGLEYLPMPNAHDMSEENQARYAAYKKRAVFYGVTRRTLNGLTGQVMLIDPVIEVPPLLDATVKDINGSGVTATQLAELAIRYVVSYGRAGLFSDFPKQVDGKEVTLADQQAGRIRPTINLYAPWDIINWRTALVGSERVLTLVVLRENYVAIDDGFEQDLKTQYRVLRLVNGIYTQEIWRKTDEAAGYVVVEQILPTDSRGELLDEIPFTFIGAMNNDSIPDDPPLYDMADMNIAHYRNSADYEESVFIVGQPTPYVTGLTESWLKDVLNGRLEFGSRGGIALPENASVGLVQMQPNAAAFEAMQHKEKQMVALGAKLVEQKSVQRTATESKTDAAAEASTLTTATKNVSAAFKWNLEWAAIFAGAMTVREDATSDVIVFSLNTNFDFATMSADEIRLAIEAWQKEAITFGEMRDYMRRSGYATLDAEQAQTDIENERPEGNDDLNPDNIENDDPNENDPNDDDE